VLWLVESGLDLTTFTHSRYLLIVNGMPDRRGIFVISFAEAFIA
jgi:hypothetical protein